MTLDLIRFLVETPDAESIWWFNISWLRAHLWQQRADGDWKFKCYRLPLQACWSVLTGIIRLFFLMWFYTGFFCLKFSSKNGILSKNRIFRKFSKNRYTLNVFWFFWKLVSRLIRLCWFQKSKFDKKFQGKKPSVERHWKMHSNDTSHDTSARL